MISFKRLMYVLAVCLCLAGYYEIVKYTGTGIPCLFRYIFHLQCPGCGVTHMLLAVLHGDLKEAFLSHPIILLFAVPGMDSFKINWKLFKMYHACLGKMGTQRHGSFFGGITFVWHAS